MVKRLLTIHVKRGGERLCKQVKPLRPGGHHQQLHGTARRLGGHNIIKVTFEDSMETARGKRNYSPPESEEPRTANSTVLRTKHLMDQITYDSFTPSSSSCTCFLARSSRDRVF
ncbi:uncharacterized protein RBU33_000628 isoform 1-T1 [Hipposideros larvatus]